MKVDSMRKISFAKKTALDQVKNVAKWRLKNKSKSDVICGLELSFVEFEDFFGCLDMTSVATEAVFGFESLLSH